jgi:hypothetical protein
MVEPNPLLQRIVGIEKALKEGGSGGASGGGAAMNDVTGRLAKLDEAVDGLKRSQTVTNWLVGLSITIVLGVAAISTAQFWRVEDKLDAIPGKISSDMRDITRTIAASITASKQSPPQVLLVPAPVQQGPKQGR